MADEQKITDERVDERTAAKDAAIATLKTLEPNIHFDTAYNMLRADPAFQPETPEDRVYIMQHWAAAKAAETAPGNP